MFACVIVVIAASAPAARSRILKKVKRNLFFSIPLLLCFNLYSKEVFIDPGIMMPESGRVLTHQEAVEMVREWITKLPN